MDVLIQIKIIKSDQKNKYLQICTIKNFLFYFTFFNTFATMRHDVMSHIRNCALIDKPFFSALYGLQNLKQMAKKETC